MSNLFEIPKLLNEPCTIEEFNDFIKYNDKEIKLEDVDFKNIHIEDLI